MRYRAIILVHEPGGPETLGCEGLELPVRLIVLLKQTGQRVPDQLLERGVESCASERVSRP